jgi:hypothetical protein
MKQMTDGNTVSFHDQQWRPLSRDCFWRGYLSLYQGATSQLFIYYGLNITNGKIIPFPIHTNGN